MDIAAFDSMVVELFYLRLCAKIIFKLSFNHIWKSCLC